MRAISVKVAGALCASVVLCLAGCARDGDGAGAGEASTRAIATGSASDGSTKLALLTGTLRGSSTDTTACLWVQIGSMRRPILWPHGWSAMTGPLRVVADGGRVAARVGDSISLTGGDPPNDDPVPYCPGLAGSFATSGLAR